MKNVDKERLEQLNLGLIETRNLMETLAIDYQLLLNTQFKNFKFPELEPNLGITKRMQIFASALYEQFGFDILQFLITHKSDILRSLAAYFIAQHNISFSDKLEKIKILADDGNSGVREWAWLALRPIIDTNIIEAIEILKSWTHNLSPRIRRFASESTRPRGVWSPHIKQLRQTPWLAIDILTALNADKHNYVQLSVGNWLNDAAKDHPKWVKEMCTDWLHLSPTADTKKICKRALRNYSL